MTIVTKPLQSITQNDLQGLIEAGARETALLEFKGTLPVKGGLGSEDRWFKQRDGIGEYARNELLAELVAFANADGGTLVLGIQETKTEPRCADALTPLPNCEGLAKRLLDAAEDIIEPRLTSIAAHAIQVDPSGAGFVLFRAGKSLSGPHRLTTTREFYVRRGERTAKMTAQEIREHSMNLARAGGQVEGLFNERLEDAKRRFEALLRQPKQVRSPLLIRVSAAPMSTQFIDGLTTRPQLWWVGRAFKMKVDSLDVECGYPAREFERRPEFRLRSLVQMDPRGERGVNRLLTAQGLAEFSLEIPWRSAGSRDEQQSFLYFGWVFSLIVGAYAQVRHLQRLLAWDAIDFGIDISLFGQRPLAILWGEDPFLDGWIFQDEVPLNLPRYEIGPTTPINDILADVTRDISNACGKMFTVKCSVPESAIMG